MVRARLKEAERIERKPHIPESRRTPARDEVADWIDAHIVEGDWDWQATTMTDIAGEVGRSREHVANVLEHYYEPADGDEEIPAILRDAEIPTNGDEAFAAGYRAGYWDGLRDALEEAEALRSYLEE